MEKPENLLKFNLPQGVTISIPKRCAEGFRERIINLIYQSPKDVIKNFEDKKSNAPDDVMKHKYLSGWTQSYIRQINESENKEEYILFLVHLIQDMTKDVFLTNIDQLDKLKVSPLVEAVIESKRIHFFLFD